MRAEGTKFYRALNVHVRRAPQNGLQPIRQLPRSTADCSNVTKKICEVRVSRDLNSGL
jgi:hypothetical protein